MIQNINMSVDIICPLYNAEKYIESLNSSLLIQKSVRINSIRYILTESKDNTESILKKIRANYKKISVNEFSHSITREKEAFACNSDIVVFITQDIKIVNDEWLYCLVKDIAKNECDASFSKQISYDNGIEKYTRENNYPEKSYIVTKKDIDKLGLKAFFFSDAASAVKRDVFIKLNGYDNKDMPTNEDMYIAYKLIMNNYRIKYCADSEIIHSHKFSFKQLYKRYYNIGKFFKQNDYLDKYQTTKTGGSMAKYILKRAFEDKNYIVLLEFIPNMCARFFGMKIGKIK